VVNGPNINLLGKRQPEIYGSVTLEQIQQRMKELADRLNVDLIFAQSNSEGVIVDTFQQHWDDVDGAIINPAGYSQHSIAIHDVIEAVPYPTFEVHLSNIAARDQFHQADVIMPVCKSAAVGFGWRGYLYALQGAVDYLRDRNK
jgi:3-dehydroquinate dehydratase II